MTNQTLHFRKMKEQDLISVCQIEQETFSFPWSYQSFYTSMKNPDYLYLVAEKKGKIVAYCGVWVIAGEAQINNLAVIKEERGQKIASMLLSFLFSEGRKKKIDLFTLEVRQSNLAAIHLYQRAGFQTVGVRPAFYDRPKEDARIMTVIPSMNVTD